MKHEKNVLVGKDIILFNIYFLFPFKKIVNEMKRSWEIQFKGL